MSSGRYFGMYRGEVLDNQDPLLNGRIKVNVFGVYDGIKEDLLPWAIYSDPLMGGQSDLGGFFVPNIDSHVWVFFENGDPEQPVYFAGAPSRDDGPSEITSKGTYPENKIFKTRAGHLIEIDDTDGDTRIHVFHQSGTFKEYKDNGDSEEHVVGDLYIMVDGDADIHVVGDVDETVEGNVTRQINGNLTENVDGDVVRTAGSISEESSSTSSYTASGNVTIDGSRIDIG